MSDKSGSEDELERLLAARTTAHRLDAAAPMRSVVELEAWLEDRGLALVSARSAVPNATEAIVGGPIEGSWWGHREGSRIYRLLSALQQGDAGFIDLALVDGKRTLISPRLFPVAQALAADLGRRSRVIDGLNDRARGLLAALDDGRVVRSDDSELSGKAGRAARMALESGLLARSVSIHTASGRHASLLERYGDPVVGVEVGAASAAAGLPALLAAALRAAVVAQQQDVEKWLRFVEPDRRLRSQATGQLSARTIKAGSRTWLTLS
ncbi:MAG: hypothetical protein ABSB54_18620 [Acidimicrobiales bacterium]|jgi:hypothetical protein